MTDLELIERARKDAEYYGHLGAVKTVQDLASALSASLEREKRMREALGLIASRTSYEPGQYTQDTDTSNWAIKLARKALRAP